MIGLRWGAAKEQSHANDWSAEVGGGAAGVNANDDWVAALRRAYS